jgi:hypothetical protein
MPSVASSLPVDVFTDSHTYNRVWLNCGPGLDVARFLSPECDVEWSGSRSVDLVEYSDRPKPVEYSSDLISETIQVTGIIVRDNDEPQIMTSSFDEWRNAILTYSAPMCLRDLRGHRWWVSVSEPNYTGMHRKFQKIAFTAKEIDWAEVSG